MSTADAEAIAMSEALKDLLLIREMLSDLGLKIDEPTLMLEDNACVLKYAEEENLSHKSRHVLPKWKFIQDCVSRRIASLQYCESASMIADMFTKALPVNTFDKHRTYFLNLH